MVFIEFAAKVLKDRLERSTSSGHVGGFLALAWNAGTTIRGMVDNVSFPRSLGTGHENVKKFKPFEETMMSESWKLCGTGNECSVRGELPFGYSVVYMCTYTSDMIKAFYILLRDSFICLFIILRCNIWFVLIKQ